MFICSHCQSIRKNKKSLSAHEVTCSNNPKRKYKNGMLGKEPWNKGLNKDISESVYKNSVAIKNTYKEKVKNGDLHPSWTDEVWTIERRKSRSEWRKKLHRENPEAHPNRKLANNRSKMTYPEKVAYDFLNLSNINFGHQIKIYDFFVDFLVNDNIIIEIDGEYWHPVGNIKDEKRDDILVEMGYIVHRIRSRERIEERIQEILGVGELG